MAATYEQAGIGIAEVDRTGRILRGNAHLCGLLGLGTEELHGRSLFDLTHSEDVVPDRLQFRRQVDGEIDGYTLQKRSRCKDGRFLWASVTSRSIKDPNGRFSYAVRVQ